jgi:hypothetical protein
MYIYIYTYNYLNNIHIIILNNNYIFITLHHYYLLVVELDRGDLVVPCCSNVRSVLVHFYTFYQMGTYTNLHTTHTTTTTSNKVMVGWWIPIEGPAKLTSR